MKTRFYNARVLTMANQFEIIEGELWVTDDRISYIGPARPSAGENWDRQIDVQGNLLMPGFKNGHSHSAMTFLRSYADDLPLMDWLHQKIFPMEAKLNGERVYHLTKLAIMEYLSSGITANFDMYFFNESIAHAAVDTGFRTVMVGTIFDDVKQVAEQEAIFHKYQNYADNVSFKLGFHAEYTTNDAVMRELSALSHRLKQPVFAHNSETETEVAGCIERHGVTPTVYMYEHGLFDYGGGGYHCVHLSERDKQIFLEKDLSIITNPAANLKLASGIADINSVLKMGINIGIGTDGPAGNNALDMFREMFLVSGLAKVVCQDAAVVDGYDVLKMATIGSAKAMGLTDCDVLAVGKKADLIMIDLNQPNMQPLNNIVKNIVYSGSKSNIKLTMIDGIVRYEDGNYFIGDSTERVYQKANQIIAEIKSEL
ncbi:MAG: amidohydrolase [Clostridiales bacterium]|nr:MAG: amidohydrolase [Clostridiales bacterium]